MVKSKNFTLIKLSRSIPQYLASAIKARKAQVVGILGPSGGGKTTLAYDLMKGFSKEEAMVLSIDDYWKYSRGEMKQKGITGYDWEARFQEQFLKDLKNLRKGKSIHKPIYDYVQELPTCKTEIVNPRNIIILEATLDLIDIVDISIFAYAPDKIILQRRLERDKKKLKSFPNEQSLEKYIKTKSLPAYKSKLLPLMKKAHYVVDTSVNRIYRNEFLSQNKDERL